MIQFSCTPPPSANRMYVKGRIKSREYRAWLTEAGWQIKARNIQILSGPVSLELHAPAATKRDLDNHVKPTCDLLVSLNLIDGDRFKTVKRIVLEWHDQPAMLIRIESWPIGQAISKPCVALPMDNGDPLVSASMPL